MDYKNILTEADKSRFIKPIYSDIESRWNGAVPSEEDLTKFANNGAADKYKVNWPKLANDLDEQDRLIDSYKAWLKNKEADADPKTQFIKRPKDFIILGEIDNWLFVGVLSYNGAKYCDSFNCHGNGAKWCIGYKKTNRYWLQYTSENVPHSVFVLALDKDNFAGDNCKYMLQLKTRDHVECRELLAWDQVDDCYNIGRTDLPMELDEEYIEEHDWVSIISKKMDELDAECPNFTKWMSNFSTHDIPTKVDNEKDDEIYVQGLDNQALSLSLLTQWLEPSNHNKPYSLRCSAGKGELVLPKLYLLPSEYVKADYAPEYIILEGEEIRIGEYAGTSSGVKTNVMTYTLKINLLTMNADDYKAAGSPKIPLGRMLCESADVKDFQVVLDLLNRAGLDAKGAMYLQINHLEVDKQRLFESKEKNHHMTASDLADKISSIVDGNDPFDFSLLLVDDQKVSLVRSVKANTDVECILISNVRCEGSLDAYSSVMADELVDILKANPNYTVLYSIDKRPPKYVTEIETDNDEVTIDILLGGTEYFDPIVKKVNVKPFLLN